MPRLLLAATLLLGAIAAPAWAFVDAPRTLMPPEQAQALATRLETLGGYRFDAIVLQQAPEGPTVLADQVFAARQLGPAEGLIVVSAADGQVGVHLGTAIAARGLDAAAQRAVIETAWPPHQAQHDTAGGIEALAQGLADYTPAAPEAPASGPGPWGWVLAVLVLAAGAFAVMRTRREPAPAPVPLRERIAEIERARQTGELPESAVTKRSASGPTPESPPDGPNP